MEQALVLKRAVERVSSYFFNVGVSCCVAPVPLEAGRWVVIVRIAPHDNPYIFIDALMADARYYDARTEPGVSILFEVDSTKPFPARDLERKKSLN